MLGVNTQIMEPTRAMMPPAMMGRRRPIWSEMAPPRTWPVAKPTKKVVSVKPSIVEFVARSTVICGNAAEYMSVAIGGTAFCTASVISRATVSAPPTMPSRSRVSLVVMMRLCTLGDAK